MFKCETCDKTFLHKYHLNQHSRSRHNIELGVRRGSKCAVCQEWTPTNAYHRHLLSHHISVEQKNLLFKDFRAFEDWKQCVENNESVRFIRRQAVNKTNIIKYICNRNPYQKTADKQIAERKRKPKSSGNIKRIEGWCPASMECHIGDRVRVLYTSTHVGHELRHLPQKNLKRPVDNFIIEIVLPQSLTNIFAYIDTNADEYVRRLAEAVAIKSVSTQADTRGQTIDVIKWFAQKLAIEGVKCVLVDISGLADESFSGGNVLPLPPVLLGELGNDSTKKTLCIYGHLDVKSANFEDGWDSEPFVLTEMDGKLYGRGSADHKGAVLGWLHAIQAYRRLNIEIPVNLKFIIEGLKESGSTDLNKLIENISGRDNTFLADVDYVCVNGNKWLGTRKPCLLYGLRGQTCFDLEVECADKDLHSGVYGGSVHEAMTDLMALMSKLVDNCGNILIPGILDDVQPLTKEEEDLYRSIDFDAIQFRAEVGVPKLIHDDKLNALIHRWRYPSLSIHSIESSFSGVDVVSVIPRKVVAKFSIRLVPNQEPNQISQLVKSFIEEEFIKLNTSNKINIISRNLSNPWISDACDNNFIAARRAIIDVYHEEPDLTRDGGSLPVVQALQSATGKNVLLLPMSAASTDSAHSQNENISRFHYIEFTKVLAAYIYEISRL